MDGRAYFTTGYCFLYCTVIYFIFAGFVENAKIGKIFVEISYIMNMLTCLYYRMGAIMSAQASYPYLKDQII
ncbi:24133_t:CDS:2, partial [Gigaspora rosea]